MVLVKVISVFYVSREGVVMVVKVFEHVYGGVRIEVWSGDITRIEADAIVNPANSLLLMGGGVAGAIKRMGGVEIEREALKYAPVPVGKAVATKAGKLKARAVIHAPTMERPAMRTSVEKVRAAVKAALECAEEKGFVSVAFPGMGTGVGGVPVDKAAHVMVEVVKELVECGTSIKCIMFVGFEKELTEAFITKVKELLLDG